MAKEWTDDEVDLLINYTKHGLGWLEIGEKLGRTSDSIRMYWRNHFGETGKSGKMKDPKYISANTPRIWLFDVETLPLEGYAWQLWDWSFTPEQVISGTGLLSWAGKFLNAPDMYSDILTPKEAKVKDDKRIAESCHNFLKDCDILVGHNLIDFDFRVISTYFLKYDLPPLKPILVDTLKIAKRSFRFDSNKMAWINKYLGIKQKIETEGFPLWRRCREGDPKALKTMQEYNEGDVLALEDLYYRLRPYIRNINVALYNEGDISQCPVCGSEKVKEEGTYYTPAGQWVSYRCQECKCLSRGKDNKLPKGKRKKLLVNS